MQTDLDSILHKVLEIINYKEDRAAFNAQFAKNIQLQTIATLLTTLTTEKQEELKSKLGLPDNDTTLLLEQYFASEQIRDTIIIVSKNAFISFIESITPTLSTQQKEQISNLLQSISQSQT